MNCPNCASNNTLLFHNKVWSMDNGKVYQCNICTLLFIHPMMSFEDEQKFYSNYNEHVKNRGMIVQDSIEEFHAKSLEIAQERLSVVQPYFDNKKVLEIGSSTGAFLSLLNNSQTYACELATTNREFSKQFISGEAYSSVDDVLEKSFDVICMFHVFEHIREPIIFLKKCLNLLKKDGVVIIEVPHSNDPLIMLYNSQEFKDFVFQPMHPMVYNKTSLDFVFQKAGLSNQSITYHQRYGLDNHLSWLKNKKTGKDDTISNLFSNNKEYKVTLQKTQNTDTIFYIAKATHV